MTEPSREERLARTKKRRDRIADENAARRGFDIRGKVGGTTAPTRREGESDSGFKGRGGTVESVQKDSQSEGEGFTTGLPKEQQSFVDIGKDIAAKNAPDPNAFTPAEQETKVFQNDFFSIEGQKERIQNAGQVLWQVLPMTEGRVSVNIENDIIRYGLEKAVNNPMTTALLGVAAWYLASATLTALTPSGYTGGAATVGGSVVPTATGPNLWATNTATTKIIGGKLGAAGFTVAAAWVVQQSAQSLALGKFQITEALQTLSLARWQAIDTGNEELAGGLDQLQYEILNPTGWDAFWRKVPIGTNVEAAKRNVEAANANMYVFQEIARNKTLAKEQGIGENSSEYWDMVNQKQVEQEKLLIDYYNEERKKMVEWENQAKADAREATLIKEKEERIREAQFWEKQREEQRKLEEAERIKIAAFWLEYRKQLLLLQTANSRSQLNFGGLF